MEDLIKTLCFIAQARNVQVSIKKKKHSSYKNQEDIQLSQKKTITRCQIRADRDKVQLPDKDFKAAILRLLQ